MAKDSEMDVVVEAQSVAKSIAAFTSLPARIDKAAFSALATRASQHIGAVDELKKQLATAVNAKDADVKELRLKIADIRTAVKGAYGADSSEYERVGGTRSSERKRPARKTTAAK